MCEACHTSPHELQSEYIYGTKETFNKYHAKSCPSWKEGGPKTAVPTGCYFQALSSNQSIKPSKVFACPGPATAPLLNADVTEEDRRLSRLMTRIANGDLRPRQAAEGRGSVAPLAADGSDGYHYHDVALTKLYIPDFLRRYVHNMDDFKSMFAKAGESPLSKGSILGDREQLLTDAVSSFLAFVNEDLREDSGLKKKQVRDAVGEKDVLSPFRYLCEGVTNYASSSAQLVLVYVHRYLGEIKEIKNKMYTNQEHVVLSPDALVSREPCIVVTRRDTSYFFGLSRYIGDANITQQQQHSRSSFADSSHLVRDCSR
jgi:hypothetical protein